MKQKLRKALREMAAIGLVVALALFAYNGILTAESFFLALVLGLALAVALFVYGGVLTIEMVFPALVLGLALSPIPWSAYRLGRFVFTR